MTRNQFVNLKPGIIIFNNIDNLMVTVNSKFINIDNINNDEDLTCEDFFIHDNIINIKVFDHLKWKQFQVSSFMKDLNQSLINKILLKKIIILENKLKNIKQVL